MVRYAYIAVLCKTPVRQASHHSRPPLGTARPQELSTELFPYLPTAWSAQKRKRQQPPMQQRPAAIQLRGVATRITLATGKRDFPI